MVYVAYMETNKDRVAFTGRINPKEKTAAFTEKLDSAGRLAVPRVVRDKLGLSGKEAILSVQIVVEEIYQYQKEEAK